MIPHMAWLLIVSSDGLTFKPYPFSFILFFPMMFVFTNLGLAIIIWSGGRLTILGHIAIGDFVAFVNYLNLLAWPMMAIG